MDRKAKISESISKLSKRAETDTFDESFPQNPDEAWNYLMKGNQRFLKGDITGFLGHINKEVSSGIRQKLTEGQKPYVTIVTCSDSRVAPELLFDEGLGRVFIIRVAGNIVDNFALGTVEYVVHHLHTPLLVIMGHQLCGAVKATKDCKGEAGHHGDIPHLVKEIWPACKCQVSTNEAHDLDGMIQQNVRNTKEKLLKNPEVKKLVDEKKLKIVIAEYYLDTGKVAEISDHETCKDKVCYGDVVTIKNSKTGGFLSGEKGKGIFGATSDEKGLWVVTAPHGTKHHTAGNPVTHGDHVILELKGSGANLSVNNGALSVATNNEQDNLHIHVKTEGNYPCINLKKGSTFDLHHEGSHKYLSSNPSHQISLSAEPDHFTLEKIAEKHK